MTCGARLAAVVPLVALGALACREPERATTIELWAMGREGEVVREMTPDFERRHPGVRVHVQQIPWSAAHEKLLTAYVGGAMPDVFQVGNTWLPELAALGAVTALDGRIAGSTSVARDDYFPGILDTNVVDGVTWGVPWYVDTRLLFYRRDLLAAAGVAEPPKTWAAWTDAMTRVRARGGDDRFAILLPLREWEPPVILAMQRGAQLLADDDGRGNFASPEVRAAFAFYLDLFTRGLAPRAGDTEVTNVYQAFADGELAFLVTGPWNLGEFARRLPAAMQDRWATAPMPAPAGGDGPGVSLAGGASLTVARGTPHADLAWQLVEYLAEPAQQLRLNALAGDLPARKSAWETGGLAHNPRTAAFWTQLQDVRATPKIPEWERIAARITRYTEAAVRGDLGLDDALAALDRDVDAILEKRRWLRARAG
jgi:multiple sugar transport system substrate-binding protein